MQEEKIKHCSLKRKPNEIKERYIDRRTVYNFVLKTCNDESKAIVLSNIYVNCKYLGNKYP
jgi:hypothetical protein